MISLCSIMYRSLTGHAAVRAVTEFPPPPPSPIILPLYAYFSPYSLNISIDSWYTKSIFARFAELTRAHSRYSLNVYATMSTRRQCERAHSRPSVAICSASASPAGSRNCSSATVPIARRCNVTIWVLRGVRSRRDNLQNQGHRLGRYRTLGSGRSVPRAGHGLSTIRLIVSIPHSSPSRPATWMSGKVRHTGDGTLEHKRTAQHQSLEPSRPGITVTTQVSRAASNCTRPVRINSLRHCARGIAHTSITYRYRRASSLDMYRTKSNSSRISSHVPSSSSHSARVSCYPFRCTASFL